jgi:hypothetical protein
MLPLSNKNKFFLMPIKNIFKIYLLSILLFLGFACEDPPVAPPPPPPIDIVKNTINLTVEWTDLYRIALNWNKAEDDTLNSFLYELIRKDESGNEVKKNI